MSAHVIHIYLPLTVHVESTVCRSKWWWMKRRVGKAEEKEILRDIAIVHNEIISPVH